MPSTSYSYPFPRPMVSADILLLSWLEKALSVLLIRRKHAPYAGCWAFPGGFVDENETLGDAARRELAEETGIEGVPVEQFHTFGDPGRDPRGRTITVAYIGMVPAAMCGRARAGDDAAAVRWHRVSDPPPLAFDHREILRLALDDLPRRLICTTDAFRLLDPVFTLAELREVCEAMAGKSLDARRFRRSILASRILSERPGASGRRGRAILYSLDRWEADRRMRNHDPLLLL